MFIEIIILLQIYCMAKTFISSISHDDVSDSEFIEYDPKKDTVAYPVYRNDIKFKKHRNIDPSRAIWADDVKSDFNGKDTDLIDYRIEECAREKYTMIDLSYMEANCFFNMVHNNLFSTFCNSLQHIFAENSKLDEIPDIICLKFLLTLDVSSNRLTKLPKLPASLEELIVNNNKLTSIQQNLPKLLRFNGNDNNISEFNCPPLLERIHLKNNPIAYIPRLDNLYFLDIATTKISHLFPCKNLKWLDISYTQIKALPEMDSLQHLTCIDASLQDITKLKNLHAIEMSGSQIVHVQYLSCLSTLVYKNGMDLKLSKKYLITHTKKNENDDIEITFAPEKKLHIS